MADRRAGAWRAVAISMGAGAVYDLGFAVAILAFTRPAAAMLGLTVPEDAVYLYLNGVFLLLVAGMYALPARDPQRYEGVVVVAAAGRAAGFVVLALCWAAGRPAVFLALALVDLVFAGAHAALLARARRS